MEHICICLFAMYMSPLVRCLVGSLTFLIRLSVLLFSFKDSLHILDPSPSSVVSFANIFSQPVACLLILFRLSVFNFNEVQLTKDLFVDRGFAVTSKKASPDLSFSLVIF